MFMYINTTIPCKQLPYKGLSIKLVLEAGLEPARLLRPKDFKSFVSTDSTIRATLPFFEKDRITKITVDLLDGMSEEAFSERAFAWRGRETVRRNAVILEETPEEHK